jgi:hypothetical protein
MKLFSTALVATVICLAPPVLASPRDDLAFAVSESNHDKQSGWIIERLVTLEVGDACWTKILDKNTGAVSKLASTARYIARAAKEITGDDWMAIEAQTTNSKEANRAIVDKMVTEFQPKFHLTVRVAGGDCETKGQVLWLNYTSSAALATVKYPPKSGRMNIVIEATPAKGFRADMNKDGTELHVVGSRDIEVVAWSDTIERALKRVSTKN